MRVAADAEGEASWRKFEPAQIQSEVGSILPFWGPAPPRLGSTKGQTTVEFAMVSILFFLLMFAVMDFGWLMFAQMNIQQAVDDGGRFGPRGMKRKYWELFPHIVDHRGYKAKSTCPA